MKYSLHDLSIVIPVRIDHEDRLVNLDTVLRYFDAFFENAEVAVIESGPEQRCAHLDGKAGISYAYVPDGGPFRKCALVNRGVRGAQRRFVAMHDADVLFRPEAIAAMLAAFRRTPQAAYGLPYNGVFLDIDGPDRTALIESLDFTKIPWVERGELHRDYGNSIICVNPVSMGGANYFRKDVFVALGGFNEKLVSCVWEDYEIEARFVKMGYRPCVVRDANALHLHHARVSDSESTLYAQANEREYQRVAQMTREQLEEYIRTELLR